MKTIKIFFALCAINFKHLLIYRASFWITFLLMAGWAGAYVTFIEVIFGHIDTLAGWGKGEALLVLSYYYLFQNISDIFYKDNFEEFSDVMRRGELDFRIIKPVSSRLLAFCYKMRFDQLASLVVTAGLFAYALSELKMNISPLYFSMGILYTTISVVLYYSILSIISTFAFWMQKSDTFKVLIWNVSQVARYPRQIYTGIIGKVLTFIIPIAGLASVPAEIALQFDHGKIAYILAGITIVMMAIAQWFWSFGLKRYSSAG
ncbi:MAG: ABC-2 family transporter protein [Patescibacteria group bacterium]